MYSQTKIYDLVCGTVRYRDVRTPRINKEHSVCDVRVEAGELEM